MNGKKDKEVLLTKAFDSATVNGKLISLNTEAATAFIDTVVDQSVLLKAARVEKMSTPIKDIAKILDTGDFLKPSYGRSLSEVAGYDFGSDMIQLISQEVTGNIMVFDQDLDDNIEGVGITNKLLGLITKKIANELEVMGILGVKKAIKNVCRDMFDGFRKRANDGGHVIDANSTALFSDRLISKAKFVKAFKAMPTKFRTPNLMFFAASDTIIDYDGLFDNNFNRQDMISKVLGKPLVEVPLMPIDSPVPTATASTTSAGTSAAGQPVLNVAASTNFATGQNVTVGLGTAYEQTFVVLSVGSGIITMTTNLTQLVPDSQTVTTVTLDGTDSLLTDPKNLIYGIQTENMSFETERVPNKGYRYYFKMRLDFQIEEVLAIVLLKNLKNT